MIIFLSLLTLLFGCQKQEKSVVEKLYIFHAEEGVFERDPSQPNLCTLEMISITNDVAYFNPTPMRKAGTLTLAQFLASWQSEQLKMKEAPKSEGFVFYDKESKGYGHLAIKLIFPTYDPKLDKLTFILEAIDQDFPFDRKEVSEVTIFLNLSL